MLKALSHTEGMMAEIVFYHAPQTRSVIVRWMLEEVGARWIPERGATG
jgi:hypothetical protein